jgi:hypothetical protein
MQIPKNIKDIRLIIGGNPEDPEDRIGRIEGYTKES